MNDRKYLWGLDLSLSCSGVAIYDLSERAFVFIGSFETDKIKKRENRFLNSLKLKAKADWLLMLMKQYPPYFVGIERGFSQFNTATQNIFRVHGMVNYLFWDVPTEYYPPNTVKEALVHGSGTKEDLQNTISTKYNYIFSNEDESDAFAVALTALVKNGLLEWEKPNWNDIRLMRKSKEEKAAESHVGNHPFGLAWKHDFSLDRGVSEGFWKDAS